MAGEREGHGHGRVDVGAREMAGGVDHDHHDQAEYQRHADRSERTVVHGVGNDRAASGEDEGEGGEALSSGRRQRSREGSTAPPQAALQQLVRRTPPADPHAATSRATDSASYATRSIVAPHVPALGLEHREGGSRVAVLGLARPTRSSRTAPRRTRATQGLWVWPNTSTSQSAPAAIRSNVRAGLSSNRYSLTLRGEPCTRRTRVPPSAKRRSKGRLAHEVLERRSVCARVQSTDRWPSSRSCGSR